ncbi:hypothetical protein ON010_g8192 [Phytophthora cinnamomi]|nr:hypothetical protein ON010_g8192 [Phytophthora cinnamomi]
MSAPHEEDLEVDGESSLRRRLLRTPEGELTRCATCMRKHARGLRTSIFGIDHSSILRVGEEIRAHSTMSAPQEKKTSKSVGSHLSIDDYFERQKAKYGDVVDFDDDDCRSLGYVWATHCGGPLQYNLSVKFTSGLQPLISVSEGRCEQWAARMALWSLEVHRVDFDGAAKLSDRRGSAGCILWKSPFWDAVEARGFSFDGITLRQFNRIPEKLVKSEVPECAEPEPISLEAAAEPLTPDAEIFMVTRKQARRHEAEPEEVRNTIAETAETKTDTEPGYTTGTTTPAALIPERWRQVLAQQEVDP